MIQRRSYYVAPPTAACRTWAVAKGSVSIPGMSDGERRRWVVVGPNADGQMASITVETSSADKARAVALKNGIAATSVEPEMDPNAPPVAYALRMSRRGAC